MQSVKQRGKIFILGGKKNNNRDTEFWYPNTALLVLFPYRWINDLPIAAKGGM